MLSDHPMTTGNACFAEDLCLCRGPNLRHSAKTRASSRSPWQRLALGKDTLCKFGPLGHGGLSFLNQLFGEVFSISIFLFFIYSRCRGPEARAWTKTLFAEGPRPGPRQRTPLLSASRGPRQRFFVFLFLSLIYLGNIIHCFKLNFKIWANFDYIYIFS